MPIFSFLLWLCLIWSAGWLFFPISKRLFEGVLPDAGLSVGRVLFLVVWTLAAFWLGFAGVPVAWSAGLYLPLALVGLGCWFRDRMALRETVLQNQRAMLSVEAVFLAVFLGFFLLRGFWSDTNGTNGEKGMDSALIATLARADHLPPLNPYAAGSRLQSYYYAGHLSAALLTRATFTSTSWSYNWMCATLPALCFSTLFALGAALTGRLRGGAFVALVVLVLGTLQPLYQWANPTRTSPRQFLHLYYFTLARVIPYTINEFPWFTFNQADLHAHYFSFPLQLASMTLAWVLFRRFSLPLAGLASVLLGALILTNTWDFPVYALLLLLAVGCSGRKGASRRLVIGLVAIIGALLIASPFLLLLKSTARKPQLLEQPASSLREWLLMWGPMWAIWWLYGWQRITARSASVFQWRIVLIGAVGWCGFGWLTSTWNQPSFLVLPLIGVSIALALAGMMHLKAQQRFLCVLACAGLAALLWSETTWAGYLGFPDHPGFDDFKRQDTVFKFGLQCWFLWGTASVAGLWLVLNRMTALQNAIVQGILIPFAVVMLVCSTAVTVARTYNFRRWDGWDSWARLASPEKAAGLWLQDHASSTDFLLEAERGGDGDFSDSPRFAPATGIPTVIGPYAHSFYWSPTNSGQKSKEWQAVDLRLSDVRHIYTSPDAQEQLRLLRFYKVRYVVWGELERQQYPFVTLGNLMGSHLKVVATFGASNDLHAVEILEFSP